MSAVDDVLGQLPPRTDKFIKKIDRIVVRAKAGIDYHGIVSSIPPSDLSTVSVVGEGEVTISIKH